MNKVNVIGTSGSGKSTFAKRLAQKLNTPRLEMDAIFWGKDWYWPSDEEFFANLEARLAVSAWVLDGNYTRTIPVKWREVDTLIWIDFSFKRTLFQAIKRAVTRASKRQELWPNTGNRESFKKLFSKDSIVLWTLKTYRKNKTKYVAIKNNPAYQHISFIRLTSPKECELFLDTLESASTTYKKARQMSS